MKALAPKALLSTVCLLSLAFSPAAIEADSGNTSSKPKAAANEKNPSIVRYPSHLGQVDFRHRAHVEEHEVECTSCHHRIVAKAVSTPHASYFHASAARCVTCHKASKEAPLQRRCRSCHYDYSRSQGCWDRTQSPKAASHKMCWECHEPEVGAKASKACKTCHRGKKKAW